MLRTLQTRIEFLQTQESHRVVMQMRNDESVVVLQRDLEEIFSFIVTFKSPAFPHSSMQLQMRLKVLHIPKLAIRFLLRTLQALKHRLAIPDTLTRRNMLLRDHRALALSLHDRFAEIVVSELQETVFAIQRRVGICTGGVGRTQNIADCERRVAL